MPELYEVQPTGKLVRLLGRMICPEESPLEPLCEGVFVAIFGDDENLIKVIRCK